jgi:hypothetical protein
MRAMRTAIVAAAMATTALGAEAVADSVARRVTVADAPWCAPDASKQAEAPAAAAPVLVDGFGTAAMAPDSSNPEVRRWFDQGVRMVWAFDEAEAVRAFQQAQRLDPNCAMCFWGEAWARGPTINLRPRTAELEAARTAANRAMELGTRLNPHDRWLVRAMHLRTSGEAAFRNAEYAAAMEQGALRFSDSDIMNVMAADARMVSLAARPQEGMLAQRFLERVLARSPNHSGAIHFYIHLTDWLDRQDLAERHADRLGRIAPSASHLVHMPAHTFYGVGRYQDAANVNVAAVAADQAYERRVRPPATDYRTGLYRHNLHFAINSALMVNDGRTARMMTQAFTERFGRADETQGFGALIRSATWYARGLHGDPAQVLAIPQAEGSTPFVRAMRHYARGEALARQGNAAAVRAEAQAIAALLDGPEAPQLANRLVQTLVGISRKVLEGRAAMLAGDYRVAADAYRAAMDLQLGANLIGGDPPMFWYSTRRSLGAALLAAGDHESARQQLTASLEGWPNDPLALYALSRAETALGQTANARRSMERARMRWVGELSEVPLARI